MRWSSGHRHYVTVMTCPTACEIPQVGGLANRNRLLESGQPGRLHPADPQKPHPFEFYSGVWVCHHCYVSYCRLDAIRHQVSPRPRPSTQKPAIDAAQRPCPTFLTGHFPHLAPGGAPCHPFQSRDPPSSLGTFLFWHPRQPFPPMPTPRRRHPILGQPCSS